MSLRQYWVNQWSRTDREREAERWRERKRDRERGRETSIHWEVRQRTVGAPATLKWQHIIAPHQKKKKNGTRPSSDPLFHLLRPVILPTLHTETISKSPITVWGCRCYVRKRRERCVCVCVSRQRQGGAWESSVCSGSSSPLSGSLSAVPSLPLFLYLSHHCSIRYESLQLQLMIMFSLLDELQCIFWVAQWRCFIYEMTENYKKTNIFDLERRSTG